MASFVDDVKVVLSNVFRRGRKGVDTLAVAIDQRSEIMRLTGAMRKLNAERGERIVEIGKKVYALHKRGKVRNQDVLADCERIDEIGGEMAELRGRIEELRMGDAEAALVAEVEDETPIVEEEMVEHAAAEMEAGEEPATAPEKQAEERPIGGHVPLDAPPLAPAPHGGAVETEDEQAEADEDRQ